MAYPYGFSNSFYNAYMPKVFGHNDYHGCAGDSAVFGNGLHTGPTTPASAATYSWGTEDKMNGVFFARSIVRMNDITDGLSTTLMLGEGNLDPDFYFNSYGNGDNQGWCIGYDYDNLRWVANGATPATATPPQQDQPGIDSFTMFGSAHANGCHFAFCDGSVRMLNYTIDGPTFYCLGVRNDGLVINAGQF